MISKLYDVSDTLRAAREAIDRLLYAAAEADRTPLQDGAPLLFGLKRIKDMVNAKRSTDAGGGSVIDWIQAIKVARDVEAEYRNHITMAALAREEDDAQRSEQILRLQNLVRRYEEFTGRNLDKESEAKGEF